MNRALSLLGFLEVTVEAPRASDRQRLEAIALEVGSVDMRPTELFEEVLALIADGAGHPSELADATLRMVRGAEVINAMIARVEGGRQTGTSRRLSLPSDQLFSED